VLLHEDAALLVVDKPAGLLAVPGRGPDKQDCLIARLQRRWPQALTVHRLDEATSGLMVFALDAAAQRALGRAFERREVSKRYTAVVHGRPAEDAGEIALPIGLHWPDRPRRRIDAAGQPALTRWTLRAHDATTSRLVLEPLTGRTHQLRVHLAAIGHPIVGDRLYGPEPPAAPRLLLHASALAFTHPTSGTPQRFEAEAPF
jgi:tRNA pseudouridine32 synthase/23S rRNA pseudouridine746 synthase